ncbi:hypothetical protein Tco_0297862, partial [Tanacetum coccineum]
MPFNGSFKPISKHGESGGGTRLLCRGCGGGRGDDEGGVGGEVVLWWDGDGGVAGGVVGCGGRGDDVDEGDEGRSDGEVGDDVVKVSVVVVSVRWCGCDDEGGGVRGGVVIGTIMMLMM